MQTLVPTSETRLLGGIPGMTTASNTGKVTDNGALSLIIILSNSEQCNCHLKSPVDLSQTAQANILCYCSSF